MLGRYQVLKPLAKGGMAEVLLARTIGIKGFERHVVIKRTRVENPDQKAIDMFLDEARLVASLHHRNIVQVHDVGEEGGNYFFAMEYVHGKDARELLRHVKEKKQQVPLEHVITIVTAAAAGLHYAHEQRGPDRKPLGIVHRDISPGNILIGFDGGVKVVDFGIAKTEVRSADTQVGELKGKLGYMSPEQCRTQAVDRRTDVFLLGIVLWELCTVRRLFKADSRYEMMEAIVDGKIPPASKFRKDIPEDLDKIIKKSLSIAPDDRYQTADELRLVLEAFARRSSLQISPAHLSDYLKEEFGEVAEPWLTEDGPPRLDEQAAAEVIRRSQPTLPVKSEEPPSNETPMAWPTAPAVSSKKLAWIVGTVLGLGAAGALLMFAFKKEDKPKTEPAPVVAPVETPDAAVEPVAVETPDAAVEEAPVDAGAEVAVETPDAGVTAVAANPEKPKKPNKRPRPRPRPDKPDKPDISVKPDKPPKPDDLDSPFPD